MCSLLTDEGLPDAGSCGVTGEIVVGLKTNFTGNSRLYFTLVPTGSWEQGSAELNLNEDLGIEGEWRRVEWSSRNGRVDVVGCSDRVATR